MSKWVDTLRAVWTKRSDTSEAKSFTENQLQEDAFDAKQRGTRTVPLKQIVGSVGRYQDFDARFQLKPHLSSDRFERIRGLMQQGRPLPPILLYQIKDEFYVLDGNHRVSAAKDLGFDSLEGKVLEFIPSTNTLENMLYREKADFLEQTGLRQRIDLTEIGQYQYLLNQIEQHQRFLEDEQHTSISFAAAASDWYDTIYQPLITLIERERLLNSFPRRSIADLYTYISSHQWERHRQRQYGKALDRLIPNNMEEFRKKMAAGNALEYPDMKQEITIFILMNVEARRQTRLIKKLFALKEVREIHAVHGNVDLIAKVVLTRDLLASDAETISHFVHTRISQIPGIINTQTLIPGFSKIKEDS